MGGGTKARVFSSTSFLAIGVAVNALLGLLIARTLARYLGVAGYGQYALAFVYLSFTTIIANFGFDSILIRDVSRDQRIANEYLTAGIVLKLLFGLGALLLGGLYIFSRDFTATYQTAVLLLLSTHFVAAFETLEIAHKSNLQGKNVAVASMVSQILTLGIVLWGSARGWSLAWLIASHLLVRGVRAAILYLLLQSYAPFRWTWNPAQVRYLLRESSIIGFTGLLWIVYFKIDQLMLEWLVGAEAVGQYAAGYKFIDIALIGSGLAMSSLAPVLADRWANRRTDFPRVYGEAVDYMGMLGAMAGGVMVVFGPDLIRHIFSPTFTEAIGILRVLSIATFLIYLNNALGHTMIAVGIQGPGFLTCRLSAAVINVVLNLILIPRWGGYGAAWATVLSEGSILLIAPLFVRQATGILFRPWILVFGGLTLWLSRRAYLASGATNFEPNWAGRLSGGAVLLAAFGIFLFAYRRQVRELLGELRNRKSGAPLPPSPGPPLVE